MSPFICNVEGRNEFQDDPCTTTHYDSSVKVV